MALYPGRFHGRSGNELTHAPRSVEVGAAHRHGEGGRRRNCVAEKRAPMVSDPGRGRVLAAWRRHPGSACQSHGTDPTDSAELEWAARGVRSGLVSRIWPNAGALSLFLFIFFSILFPFVFLLFSNLGFEF
jgi:hypothetical protein